MDGVTIILVIRESRAYVKGSFSYQCEYHLSHFSVLSNLKFQGRHLNMLHFSADGNVSTIFRPSIWVPGWHFFFHRDKRWCHSFDVCFCTFVIPHGT